MRYELWVDLRHINLLIIDNVICDYMMSLLHIARSTIVHSGLLYVKDSSVNSMFIV